MSHGPASCCPYILLIGLPSHVADHPQAIAAGWCQSLEASTKADLADIEVMDLDECHREESVHIEVRVCLKSARNPCKMGT